MSSSNFTHPVTYCTNIHPAESWAATWKNLKRFTLRVKHACSPDAPFPVGLRLSGQACKEISDVEAERFREWLQDKGLYVVTLNGFPYGTFHGVPVKEQVYLPDWRDPERLAYTRRLGDLLAGWLPPEMHGSISTVPVAFGKSLSNKDFASVKNHFLTALSHLQHLYEETGAFIHLSIEPEPGCQLETTEELIAFFERLDAPPAVRQHLACCYDCCHQALQFEDPEVSLSRLQNAGITIGHVQVSSALHLDEDCISMLQRFDEGTYLHQSVAHAEAGLLRFDDLPKAFESSCDAKEWRVHFHLPVFLEKLPECRTTQPFLQKVLPLFDAATPLEVETYTWSVLPEELRTSDVTESIIREILWVETARRKVTTK